MSQCLEDPLVASVVVPVWNGAEVLGRCLDALGSQTVDRQLYEVIVVDDGSVDSTLEIATRPGVVLIRQEHAGAAAARNRGASAARGPLLLFTDADCEPKADWIEQMLAPFADAQVVGVKGVYRTRQVSVVARFTQAEYEEKYRRLRRRDAIDFVDTHAAAYRAEALAAVGGFDPAFLLDEDQELSFRLARLGCKLIFAPAAVVFHRHPDTAARYFGRKVRLGCWKVRVLARHPSKALRDSYTPWTQKAQILLWPLVGCTSAAALLRLLPWSVAGLLLLLSLSSSLPLVVGAVRQGWAVAVAAPALVAIRALALALGMAWGVLRFGFREPRRVGRAG